MHTVPANIAIRLAHLSVDVSKIHNGNSMVQNPVAIVAEYRALIEKYDLPVCNDVFLQTVERQALSIRASRKAAFNETLRDYNADLETCETSIEIAEVERHYQSIVDTDLH